MAPELYYSIAFSRPNNAVVPGRPKCEVNSYSYSFQRCDELQTAISGHSAGTVCQPIIGAPKLNYCADSKYMCLIVGGPSPVTEDAFIEWYYQIPYGLVGSNFHLTGKMTFSASAAYIKYWSSDGTAYAGPSITGSGVPMFVQPSHNQV